MKLLVLIKNYNSIQSQIDAICKTKNVHPEDIGQSAEVFSSSERKALLALLWNKLRIQELFYSYQGGDLTNVRFLCSYR